MAACRCRPPAHLIPELGHLLSQRHLQGSGLHRAGGCAQARVELDVHDCGAGAPHWLWEGTTGAVMGVLARQAEEVSAPQATVGLAICDSAALRWAWMFS